MDFSKVKDFSIKEGKVKELSINGVKVWSKKPSINYITCIKATGTQYVKTPVLMQPNYIVDMNVRIDRKGGEIIHGIRHNGETCVFKYNSTSTWLVQLTSGYKQLGQYLVDTWYHIVIDYGKKTITINGQKFGFAPYEFATINKGLVLFAFDNNGNIQYNAIASMKDYKITDSNGVALIDYRAVLDSNNRPALYDEVSKTYKYSEIGEFEYEL